MFLTLTAAATAVGVSPSTLRARCASGAVPGAIRLGGARSPWRVPVSYVDGAQTKTPGEGVESSPGVSASSTGLASGGDVTSSERRSVLSDTRDVTDRLRVVTTRPAVALSDVLFTIAAAAQRHYPGRDGWCVACSWQYPCPDAAACPDAVSRAHAVVIGGAR